MPLLLRLGEAFTQASHELEGRLSFGAHDAVDPITVYGYSLAYYFVFPVLCLAVAAAFYRRRTIQSFRVLTGAVTVDYLISLPFFLLLPVAERWTFAESDAIMLSDLWSSALIDFLRPISGLDNCFPSFHVSMTVILILLAHRFRLRGRFAVTGLGAIVILSTFVLGIHWIPDMIAGVAVAVVSVVAAQGLDRRLGSEEDEKWPGGSSGAKLGRWLGGLLRRPRQEVIFLSYRRDDRRHVAARICEHLERRFGDDKVSMDVGDIAPGEPGESGSAIRCTAAMWFWR